MTNSFVFGLAICGFSFFSGVLLVFLDSKLNALEIDTNK
jgi:hypothetical protein